MRALESRRAEPIVDDPHAVAFLRPSWRLALRALGPAWARMTDLGGWPGIAAYVAARHRWFDDRLAAALADGVCEVLVLGAGYDSRALRFPGARFWEVDHPATAARKHRLVQDHPARRVDVDFGTARLTDSLLAAGFPSGARCFVIWEGVTMYLTRSAVRGALCELHALLGPGSELVFDAFQVLDDPGFEAHVHRLSPALMPVVGEPVTFFLHPDDAPGLLAGEGWSVVEVARSGELRALYQPDRVVYPPCYVVHARSA